MYMYLNPPDIHMCTYVYLPNLVCTYYSYYIDLSFVDIETETDTYYHVDRSCKHISLFLTEYQAKYYNIIIY